ncbi:MAG: hypothetical protein GX493_06150 [Firmicutes bacterium]|nr:hypothetical protein [Bacillota bacterium]
MEARHEIARAVRLLFDPGQVVELRIPKTPKKTVSGYFDDHEKLVKAAVAADRNAEEKKLPGIYVTLNPCDPALLARAANHLRPYAETTTADAEILGRRWFPIDLDPVRPADISSTDAEHEAALDRARRVRDWLRERGWPEPVFADSGNGAHLLYRIDLPNDLEALALVNRCLSALALVWDDEVVAIDQKVANAARIWKLPGTMARKGDNTTERPHRRSFILDAPAVLEVVSRDLLETLAATYPEEEKLVPSGRKGTFDLERWIEEHGLPVVSRRPWQGGEKWTSTPARLTRIT